jgi:hypothetical protein
VLSPGAEAYAPRVRDSRQYCWLSVIVDNAVGEDADVQQNHHYGGEMGSGFSSHRVFESFRTRK